MPFLAAEDEASSDCRGLFLAAPFVAVGKASLKAGLLNVLACAATERGLAGPAGQGGSPRHFEGAGPAVTGLNGSEQVCSATCVRTSHTSRGHR